MQCNKRKLSLGTLVAILLLSACGEGEDTSIQCRVGAECTSGVCDPAGQCVFMDGGADTAPDGMVPDSEPPREGGMIDGSEDGPIDGSDDGGVCVPNRDGRIERVEVPLEAGLRATFLGATDVDFDTRGTMVGGARTWDLSGDFTGDRTVLVETRAVAGQWFAADFAGATYFTALSLESDLLGVFEITEDELQLRGVVSPEMAFNQTKLENDPPVRVLEFPLAVGNTWTTDATVSGQVLGVLSRYSENYSSEVDAAGTLITPFGTFDRVLRVRTELLRTVGLLRTTVVSYAFVSECFGTIAVLRGQDNDDGAELTELAEIRRLTP